MNMNRYFVNKKTVVIRITFAFYTDFDYRARVNNNECKNFFTILLFQICAVSFLIPQPVPNMNANCSAKLVTVVNMAQRVLVLEVGQELCAWTLEHSSEMRSVKRKIIYNNVFAYKDST